MSSASSEIKTPEVVINYDEVITLASKNGEKAFTLSKREAYMSILVKTMFEQDKSESKIELSSVSGKTLESVVSYLKHHNGTEPSEIRKPLRSIDMEKVVGDSWDATFINTFPQQELFDLIVAANYMDIQSLLHLGCAKVASSIKGKTNEEIKALFSEGRVGATTIPAAVPAAAAAIPVAAGSPSL